VDEIEDFTAPVREAGLTASLLIAPTTPMERAARIAKASSGFVYLLARTGITGERTDAPEVAERIAALREVTDLPIACGFGISTPEQVKAVAQHADAVIVGSALVRRVEDAAKSGADATAVARDFVASLAAGLK
jgi:tryptophan synthase alpha chain